MLLCTFGHDKKTRAHAAVGDNRLSFLALVSFQNMVILFPFFFRLILTAGLGFAPKTARFCHPQLELSNGMSRHPTLRNAPEEPLVSIFIQGSLGFNRKAGSRTLQDCEFPMVFAVWSF